MWEYILFTCLSPFILWLLYWCNKVICFEWYLWRVPGPVPLPFVGNALELANATAILSQLMKYYVKYKTNFRVYIGSQPYLYICEPKDVEFLSKSSTILTKSDLYKFMHDWLGLGLLNSGGDLWRKRRKIIIPAFHFRLLEEFIEVFNATGDILVTKLMSKSDDESFDIHPFITRCALDIICETAMGTSVNAQDNFDSEYVKSVNSLLKIVTHRFFSPILSNETLYPFTKTHKIEQHALKVVHEHTKSVISSRKATFFGNVKKLEAIDYLGLKKRRAFLDLLLEYATKDPSLTEDDIRQEVDTFMFTGHTTTAASITFTLYALAMNRDVQEKAYAELQTLFADDPKRSPSRKDLQQMTYLETVIMESLRMYATVPVYGRTLDTDVNWNGKMLPKGLMIVVFVYGIHNSTSLYENPEKFEPDRFKPERFREMNPYTYVPFSSGIRSCAGQKFALLKLKSVISNILRNFELLPAIPEHKLILRGDGILKSDNGVFLRLKRRNV